MGSLMYLVGCFQGSTEALRSIQQPTHFTDFVISHSHLTVFGTFVVWAIGGTIYTWPRIHGRACGRSSSANWSFWLITCGITLMGLGLSTQGLQQGFCVDERRRVARYRRPDEAVLAGANDGGDLNGHRHVAARL